MINLNYLLLSLKTDKDVPIGPSTFATFLSSEYNKYFPQQSVLAKEKGASPDNAGGTPAYFYPRLQYKVVRGSPMIAAINEGCGLLWNIYSKLEEISEMQPDWKILEKRLIEKKVPFGVTDDIIKYRFLTPWLALPEEQFQEYLLVENEAQHKMLARVLEGHLRSVSKSLGYEIKDEIRIRIKVRETYIFQRDIHMAGLFGSFFVNFEIPSLLGLGKSVSRGFGTIKRI